MCGPRGRLQVRYRCGSCVNRNLGEIIETSTLVNARRKRKGRRGRKTRRKERRKTRRKERAIWPLEENWPKNKAL